MRAMLRLLNASLSAFARGPNGGLIVLSSPATSVNRELITDLAARLRLPAVYPYPFYVKARWSSF